jgi:putative heme-binding domain-containing protein
MNFGSTMTPGFLRQFQLACRFGLLLIVTAATLAAVNPFAENVRPTDPLTPEQQQKSFHLPPGFEIQLVAAEPDLRKPMNMAFDAQGRLWVTESREYPYAAPVDKPARDSIRIFSDFDETGRARKMQIFADGLNIPIGLYPYKNGCIAWSIPNIWWFEDTDGDGKADKREVLFGPLGWERDTHGNQSSFTRGFDGWLYITHGYNNISTVRGQDGSEIKMHSGNVYRVRVNGSRVEQFTWGQVNPFGLCFDPFGDLFAADCHSEPIYQLLRGGYYPSFGKPDDGLGFAPSMIFHSHDSTAISGVSFYADNLWPVEFRDNVFTGNVMTSRVNRDMVAFNGSSALAEARPDFVSTDDPWFRPVNIQLGPDGALYIADFYNRIIGHYEVPLEHPGRDRERGRIWRVVYRGSDGKLKLHARKLNLAQATAPQLVRELSDPNPTWRMLALNELCDRVVAEALPEIEKVLEREGFSVGRGIGASRPRPSTREGRDEQVSNLLWAMHRLNGLRSSTLSSALDDSSPMVRAHVLRILAETKSQHIPTATLRTLAVRSLDDRDPLVKRCAAEALGQHPAITNVKPLLALLDRIPDVDTHLRHMTRMSLRNQLREPEHFRQLNTESLNEREARAIADVSVAIQSAEAGAYLLKHVQQFEEPRDTLIRYLRHIARFAPEERFGELATFARTKFPGEVDLQLALFKSIQEGAAQRGIGLSGDVREWGATLADQLLESAGDAALDWRYTPLAGAARRGNPWFVQTRPSADGNKTGSFLCSLPPGGEQLTGILRSKPFVIPAQLKFFIAGHDGFPDKPAQKRNVFRLREMGTDRILAETAPPRNDLAQAVSWKLESEANRTGYLEIVDGDSGEAYAWLAVGRIEPPVVPIPLVSPSQISQRLQAAAELARSLSLTQLEPKLVALLTSEHAEVDSRAAAAQALVALRPSEGRAALSPLIADAALPAGLRSALTAAFVSGSASEALTAVKEAMRTAPARLQSKLAQALAGSAAGAEQLLQLVEQGQAPPRLLLERSIKDKLAAAKPERLEERLEKLSKGLSPLSADLAKLLDQKRAAYSADSADPVAGARVFQQTCAVCHQIDGQGALVGPQLDGIGNRGLERLIEDILDPNRNVDVNFRSVVLTLKDGDIVSGLFRREEGALLILADATGKELSIPKADVQSRHESETSLMPENFADVISPADFNHLLAYLLSKGSAAEPKK